MPRKVVTKALQRYWRVSRGLTIGAQACVLDPQNRILLIRHTYRPGWHFPGGGVEKMETIEAALARELFEEAGVLLDGPADLFGLYANFRFFPSDHVALFVVRRWRQPHVPKPNHEIAEQGLFTASELPNGIHEPTRARIAEVLLGTPRAQLW